MDENDSIEIDSGLNTLEVYENGISGLKKKYTVHIYQSEAGFGYETPEADINLDDEQLERLYDFLKIKLGK